MTLFHVIRDWWADLDWETAIIGGCVLVVVSLLVIAVVVGQMESRAQVTCEAAGFPDVRFHLMAPTYCVKRVNQTDVMVNVDSVP